MSGLSRLQRAEGLPEKVCIFGEPKTGKTSLIGTLARAGYHIIFIDVANEVSVLLDLPLDAQENITYIPVQDTADTPLAHATVDKLVRGGDFHICGTHGRVDCKLCKQSGIDDWIDVSIPKIRTMENKDTIVVIDNMSQVTSSVAASIQKGKTLIGKIEDLDAGTVARVTEKESYEDYRINGAYLSRILSYIQTAPYHCIVTAHVVEAKTETGSEKYVPYIGTSNYSANVGRFFGHVLYTSVVNGKFKVFSKASDSNKVLCGSRFDAFDANKMEKVTLAPLFDGSLRASAKSSSVATALKTFGKAKEVESATGVSDIMGGNETKEVPAVNKVKVAFGKKA